MKFKVGDKVKIVSGCPEKMSKYLDTIQEISEIAGGFHYMKNLPKMIGAQNCGWWPEELEYPVVPEFFDKATALKLAIDGYAITRESFGGFFVFNGVDFTSKYFSGYEEKASGILNYEDGWCLYKETTPEPKFSKGDFVITSTGKLGLVLDVFSEPYRPIRYKVRFDFRVIAKEPEFTVEEDTITKVVDEMLEPKGVN